jgi:hypothetical protein
MTFNIFSKMLNRNALDFYQFTLHLVKLIKIDNIINYCELFIFIIMRNVSINNLVRMTKINSFDHLCITKDNYYDSSCPICTENIKNEKLLKHPTLMFCEKCNIMFAQGCFFSQGDPYYSFHAEFISKYKYRGDIYIGSPIFYDFDDFKKSILQMDIIEYKCTCNSEHCKSTLEILGYYKGN